MASKSITELDAITQSQIANDDNFVLEHDNTAMRMSAQTFISWAANALDGHGGIKSIEKTGTSGLVDTYTITFSDETTSTFTITNGEKGDKGDTGDTGDTGEPAELVYSSVAYQKSTSGSVIPTGTWSSNVPQIQSGEFLWTRTTLNFNTGDPVISYSVGSAGEDGTGVGTVTSVELSAGAGIVLAGDTIITSSGTVEIGHTNSVNAKTTQAVYPVTIDEQGHVASVGDAYNPVKTFSATLSTNWSSGTQIVSSANFVANGYSYIVAPSGNPSAYAEAQIYADDVTTNGSMKFHCLGETPSSAIDISIVRMVTE